MSVRRSVSFEALTARISDCRRCEEMEYSHVLGPANGALGVRVLIVGEDRNSWERHGRGFRSAAIDRGSGWSCCWGRRG